FENALDRLLEQDFPSDKMEILVVDDGSTDRTPEIVRKFEPRLRLIRKANGGQASAFNAGIPQANGEIVAFLDGDDWWAPSKLREVVDVFEENPSVGSVGHGYYEVDLDAPKYELIVPERNCRLTLSDTAGARSWHTLCSFLGTSKLAVRKEVLDRILPVPAEIVFIADAFINILAVAIGGAIVLKSAPCYYRVHAENLFETVDPVRIRRRQEMVDCYVERVFQRLPVFGTPPEVLAALAEPWRVDNERAALSRAGGNPWRTFQAERASYRWTYGSASFGYKVFKALTLGLTLFMPPRHFYQLKRWYSETGLRRYREKLGNAEPGGAVRVLRHSVESLATERTTGRISQAETARARD
ncbi:MAG: glycosyltransferase family 2 protein, partial [Terriglobia bacterium]